MPRPSDRRHRLLGQERLLFQPAPLAPDVVMRDTLAAPR